MIVFALVVLTLAALANAAVTMLLVAGVRVMAKRVSDLESLPMPPVGLEDRVAKLETPTPQPKRKYTRRTVAAGLGETETPA